MKMCLACGRAFDGESWTCPGCAASPALADGFPAFAPELARGGFDDSEFGVLVSIEPESFWFAARNALITWAIAKYFAGARRFLEIGCGTGFVLQAIRSAFPGMALSASEIDGRGLVHAARRVGGGAWLFQMDARRIPFADEFDAIGAFDVLEHVDEDLAVLREMRRAVKPGGGVVLTVPQHPELWSPADDAAHHKRRYRPRELAAKVREAGLEPVCDTSFMVALALAVLVKRGEKKEWRHEELVREHRHARPVRLALDAVLGAERALIRAGVRFPFGGSRLVVAMRPR